MTETRTRAGVRFAMTWLAALVGVALIMALVGALAPPADAAAPLTKATVIPHLMWRADSVITEGAVFHDQGIGCASDLGQFSRTQRLRICEAKQWGVWQGSRFYPNQRVDRGQLARYYREITDELNRNYRRYMSQKMAVEPYYNGWCGDYYDDCARANGWVEKYGIAFVTYWNIDDGYSWPRQFDPNVKIDANANARRGWDRRAYWSGILD